MFNVYRIMFAKLLALIALPLATANVEARVFKHVDPASGVTMYSNVPSLVDERRPNWRARRATKTFAAVAANETFPKINAAKQRERDTEARLIIEDELRAEQSALNEAVANKLADHIIRRYQANIISLQREIDRLKMGAQAGLASRSM
jgi:hypothetical protein